MLAAAVIGVICLILNIASLHSAWSVVEGILFFHLGSGSGDVIKGADCGDF
eukprot:TRINITY_DN6834_c0_g1_i1.p2 TRINITY_DN6834_c0_g1~~TRINITY_DN6834_c0_g1_i1.p2  ORF type:complete len:51 (-),score=0.44 TRINITY_DN6834_c0_g1_i1:270-422(-)